jgi:hypothetical protein
MATRVFPYFYGVHKLAASAGVERFPQHRDVDRGVTEAEVKKVAARLAKRPDLERRSG